MKKITIKNLFLLLIYCTIMSCSNTFASDQIANLQPDKNSSTYISSDQFNEIWENSKKYLTPELETESTPYVYHWGSLKTQPKAIVFCIHGLTIHAFAYCGIGKILANNGYLVICADQHGFGRFYANPNPAKNDKTLHYYKVLDDFAPLLEKIRIKYPTTKIYCMGESTGGHLTLRAGCKYSNYFSGLIVSSASLKTKMPSFNLLVNEGSQVIAHPFGQIDLTKFIGQTMSENSQTVNERMHDPLGRNFLSMPQISKYLWLSYMTKNYIPKIRSTMPILILQGDIDAIYVPKGSKDIYKNIKSNDKTLEMLPKQGHVLLETKFINPDTAKVILNWLDIHSQTKETSHDISQH